MQTYYSQTCVFIFILVSTSIGRSSACPPGCICRGSAEKRDTAICYKSWPYTHKPVEFNEPITSIEFRQLLFQDVEPYLEAVHDVSNVVIYPPMKSSYDNPVPDDLFNNVEKLEAITIHPTLDRLAPAGLGKAIKSLTNLKTLDFVGNTLHCDCTLPETIASQNILLISKSRMPAVKGCKRHGFPTDFYNIQDFLEKCAERGGYELHEPSKDIVPQVQAGLSNRRFGNIRDQNLFKAGIKHTRINSNPMKPSAAKLVPGAFSGALGKPPSGNLRLREPGAKRVLLPGGLSAFGRKKPTFSANKFASRYSKARRRGRRRLLSLDEVDIDPAFSEVIATAQGEEERQKRQATTRKKKRRRRPVKILPGMSMDDFINAHKKRGRGRRRRKNKNGWTKLSGGWSYREIRSVGGENNSDSYFPLELPVPPNGQSQQQNLWADQYLSGQRRRGERSANGQNDNIILEDELSIFNRTGYPLRGDTSNQSPTDDVEQQNVNRNMKESRGEPTDAVQLGRPVPPPVDANPRRRPHAHPPGQGHDHHRHLQDERARQLAMYQLPINDLTVKLNPFDPFEVDLFFQYILHNENLPEHRELPYS